MLDECSPTLCWQCLWHRAFLERIGVEMQKYRNAVSVFIRSMDWWMSRRIDWKGDMIQRFQTEVLYGVCCSNESFIIPLCACVVGARSAAKGDPEWVWTRWIVVCLFICYPLSMYCAAPMHDYTPLHCVSALSQCLQWLIRIVCYVRCCRCRCNTSLFLSMNIYECICKLFVFCIHALESVSPLRVCCYSIFSSSSLFFTLCAQWKR